MTLDNPTRSAGGILIGVSLKMYFDHRQTVRWCRGVRQQVHSHAVHPTATELVILPSFVSLAAAADIFAGTEIGLGAQDLCWEDSGPFTGEVDGASLRQIGCAYVEIGHSERRRLFHEDLDMLRAKLAAARRHGLTPIICVGEHDRASGAAASRICISDLEQICARILDAAVPGRIVVAYEPEWAIGGPAHAPVDYIGEVCEALSRWMRSYEQLAGSQVIYGGSAGPGLITDLRDQIDGLFLGRAAHEVQVLDTIVQEAISVVA